MHLQKRIKQAAKREYADDHLDVSERLELVEDYRKAHPDEPLPLDLDAAFVAIVF